MVPEQSELVKIGECARKNVRDEHFSSRRSAIIIANCEVSCYCSPVDSVAGTDQFPDVCRANKILGVSRGHFLFMFICPLDTVRI